MPSLEGRLYAALIVTVPSLPLIFKRSDSAFVDDPDEPVLPVLKIMLPPAPVPVELPASIFKLLPEMLVPNAFAVAIFFVSPPEVFCCAFANQRSPSEYNWLM